MKDGVQMNMRKVTAALVVIMAACWVQHALAAGAGKIAILDFYVADRIPLDALEGEVTPVGDDIFSQERKGLCRTLRRLTYGLLDENTDLRLVRDEDPTYYFGRRAEDVFQYYSYAENAQGFFDTAMLKEFASELKADQVLVGLIEKLEFLKEKGGNRIVSAKVTFLEYDPAEGEYTFVKTYEADSKIVTGSVNDKMLPTTYGRVPEDIKLFSESTTGRVFFSILELFLNDYVEEGAKEGLITVNQAEGEPVTAVGGDGESAGGNEEGTTGRSSGGGRSAPPASGSDYKKRADCIERNQVLLTAQINHEAGVSAYGCSDGSMGLAQPDYTSGGMSALPGGGVSSLSTGDVNGDGIDEVVMGTYRPGEHVLIFGAPNGKPDLTVSQWRIVNPVGSGQYPVHAATGDFNGDGDDEIAVATTGGVRYVMIFDFTGGGFDSRRPVVSLHPVFGDMEGGLHVAAGDFDGNGFDELVVSSDGGGERVRIYSFPNGDWNRIKVIDEFENVMAGSVNSVSVAAGDFDGDGRDELAMGSTAGGAEVVVFRFEDGLFNLEVAMADFEFGYSNPNVGVRVFAGDFNGDRKDDLAVSAVGSSCEGWIFQHRRAGFDLGNPYLESDSLFSKCTSGALMAAGTFE